MSFDGTYHYVRHAEVPAFEGVGWVVSFRLGRPHDTYSVCMKWAGDGEPRVPEIKQVNRTASPTTDWRSEL
jgi:hypothetical protein